MEDFEEMTLEELIESQIRDDTPTTRSESHVVLLGNTGEWVDGFLDLDSDSSFPRAHLPYESRPRINGNPGVTEEMSGWVGKLRTGTFGQKKGCKTHGMEFWQAPESGSQPYCKKCRAERYYAKAEERGAKARDTRRYT